jgi:RNA polymerase sigma-70 factor (ECF subfamily)
MKNRQQPEHELVKRSRFGDERAFLELYLRHRDNVFGFAYRMLGEREAAEDVTQDCFLNLVRQPDRFDPAQASLGTYLYAMTRNLCYKRFRGVIEEETSEFLKDFEDGGSGPLTQLLEAELSTRVARAVATLPEFQREVLILFEFEGLTLAEIAVIADVDVGAVKSRLYRARQQLRKALAPYLKKDAVPVAGRNEND